MIKVVILLSVNGLNVELRGKKKPAVDARMRK